MIKFNANESNATEFNVIEGSATDLNGTDYNLIHQRCPTNLYLQKSFTDFNTTEETICVTKTQIICSN